MSDFHIVHIYDGRIKADLMVEFFISLGIIQSCEKKLYLYSEDEGRYRILEQGKEWLELGRYIDFSILHKISMSITREVIERLKNHHSIAKTKAFFNSNPNLINLRNGVYDIEKMQLLPHNQEYAFTHMLDVNYTDKICSFDDAVTFKEYCRTSLGNDAKKIKLLLQIIGYILSGDTKAKKGFFLVGLPGTGKSQILLFIERLIGNQAVSHIPLERLDNSFYLASLSEKLVNICGELSAKPLNDINIIKMIIGNDRLTGEYKGMTPFEFECKCRLLFAGNILPAIKRQEDSTDAFVSRLVLLSFSNQISFEKTNRNLLEDLIAESEIIFKLSILEYKKLKASNYRFEIPEESKKILDDYAFQQNHIQLFIEECCELSVDSCEHSYSLYNAYIKFAKENNVMPTSVNIFRQTIVSKKGVKGSKFRKNGKNRRGYIGIRLKEDCHSE